MILLNFSDVIKIQKQLNNSKLNKYSVTVFHQIFNTAYQVMIQFIIDKVNKEAIQPIFKVKTY